MTALQKPKMTVDEGPARQAGGLLPVDPDDRMVIHHARGSDAIATRILSAGSSLKLDPPGLEITVAELFPPA